MFLKLFRTVNKSCVISKNTDNYIGMIFWVFLSRTEAFNIIYCYVKHIKIVCFCIVYERINNF